ncbi:hypothetical protein [Sphingobacterium hungaricum]|nr:hypothetical protein [Sphingobacterium hungaricum]
MITLRGVSECGKSTKVKQLAEWIINNYSHTNLGVNITNGDINGVLIIGKVKIGFNSAGDDFECVSGNDSLIINYPDIDILINTSRTKGITRRHLEFHYNESNGWLVHNIFVNKLIPSNTVLENQRDRYIMDKLISLITGLDKI